MESFRREKITFSLALDSVKNLFLFELFESTRVEKKNNIHARIWIVLSSSHTRKRRIIVDIKNKTALRAVTV